MLKIRLPTTNPAVRGYADALKNWRKSTERLAAAKAKLVEAERTAMQERRANQYAEPRARNVAIWERRQSGQTYTHLGREYGISAGRVRQIVEHETRKQRWITAQRPHPSP